MILQIVLLLTGLALIIFGADFLVDGSSAIARRAGISEFVIGLTIVGFGTSCPELVVSLTGALQGNADISVGNVVGSNIFNTLLILGLTAVIAPVAVTRANSRRDIPIALLVTFLFVAFALTGTKISFFEGHVRLNSYARNSRDFFWSSILCAHINHRVILTASLFNILKAPGGIACPAAGGHLLMAVAGSDIIFRCRK